ncbi:MAG: tetratricopeptide repeat protein [Ferruginibacter sp.]|nr:tetratricopeptide repeat protein [Ferruginibacter sp.]
MSHDNGMVYRALFFASPEKYYYHTMSAKFFFIVFMLINQSPVSRAQNNLFDKPVREQLDSIQHVLLNTNNDTLKMSASRDLHFYFSEMDRDTALYFAEQQLLLSQKLHQKLWEASAWESIGYVTQIEGNYPKAYKALSLALKLAEDPNSEKGNWNIKKFAKDNDAHKARFYNLTAIHILFAFLHIGTGNNKEAFESFDKAIKTAEEVKDDVGLIAAYANFGNTCRQFDKSDSAILLTNKALIYLDHSDLKTTNPPYYNFEKGNCLNTLGMIYNQTGDFPAAKKYLKEAELLCLDENSRDALVKIYISFSDVYRKTHQLDSSLYFAQKSLLIANLLGTQVVIKNAYRTMAETYEASGNIGGAFNYLKLEKTLNDSLNNSRQEKVKQYQNLSFGEEIRLLAVEKENLLLQGNIRAYAMLAGIVVFFLIAFILYRNNRIRSKVNKKLETLNLDLADKNTLLDHRNEQNELLLKEIHHRVKNNLEVVSSLLALQSAKIDDPEIHDAMLASQNRVQSMGILHQRLYQSEHLAFIEMKNYFQNLCENILDSYNETERIKVDINMDEIDLDIDTAVPVGLIVNELLTNSLKYAFPNGKKGTIRVSLEKIGRDSLCLKISDNGVGKILHLQPKGTGFGTQLVDLLTRQIDGTLMQEINMGTLISIDFKRAKAI